jgi:Predicted permease YjgP/YjgQ family.
VSGLIVFRYLSREVLITMSAVSAVLLVIIMSGRFIKYLAQAAQGLLDPGSLFMIMGVRLPGFLQLILPRRACSSASCWPMAACTWTAR